MARLKHILNEWGGAESVTKETRDEFIKPTFSHSDPLGCNTEYFPLVTMSLLDTLELIHKSGLNRLVTAVTGNTLRFLAGAKHQYLLMGPHSLLFKAYDGVLPRN